MHFLIVSGHPSSNKYSHDFNPISFELLNSVIDDKKTLILANDVRVPMPSNARLVFVANHEGPNLTPA